MMGPPTAPQQRKGPEQNVPPLAGADSTGRDTSEFFVPVLGAAWNAQMEGSTKTSSPRKQQTAAEGTVTRNRSKKDAGAAVVPTRERRGKSSVRDGGGGREGWRKGGGCHKG